MKMTTEMRGLAAAIALFVILFSVTATIFVGAEGRRAEDSAGTDAVSETETDAETEKETETDIGTDPIPPAVPSDYDVVFLSGGLPTLNLSDGGGVFSSKMSVPQGTYLVQLTKKETALDKYIICKATDGILTLIYNGKTLSVSGAAGDLCDKTDIGASFCCVKVEGGVLTSLPGKFASAETDCFFFEFGDTVSVRQTLGADKTFEGWKSSYDGLEFKNAAASVTSFILPKKAGVRLTVTAAYRAPQTLPELLAVSAGATLILEKDYTLIEPLTLTKGTYEIDLNGHDIVCRSDTAIKLLGASLTLTGDGSVESGKAQAIRVDGGELCLEGGSVSAAEYAVYCLDGTVKIRGGSLLGGQAALCLLTADCAADISGGTLRATAIGGAALDVKMGRATVSGGTFTGDSAVLCGTDDDCECRITAGRFSSDVTSFADSKSTVSRSGTYFVVTKGEDTYTVTVFSGKGGGSYAAGDKVTLTADADTSVSTFEDWSVLSGTLSIPNKKSRTLTFTMPACDLAIKANFMIGGDVSMGEIDTGRVPEPIVTEIVTDERGETHIVDVVLTEPAETSVTPGGSDKEAAEGMRLMILTAVLAVLFVLSLAISAILLVRKYRQCRAQLSREKNAKRDTVPDSVLDELAEQLSELEHPTDGSDGKNGKGKGV